MIELFRVQDREGRGPYRPGFSEKWADYEAVDHYCPPYFVEMGWSLASIPLRFTDGWHGGCAFASLDDLYRWFAPKERTNLDALGYRINRVRADRIIARTPTQVVFECRKPLARFWSVRGGPLVREMEAA